MCDRLDEFEFILQLSADGRSIDDDATSRSVYAELRPGKRKRSDYIEPSSQESFR